MKAYDLSIIQTILRTGFDLNQAIDFEGCGTPELPLHVVLNFEDSTLAEVILEQLSSTNSAEDILTQITNSESYGIDQDADYGRIVRHLINAGAKSTIQCLRPAIIHDQEVGRTILENFYQGVQGWIEADILQGCLQWATASFHLDPMIRPVFSYILQEKLDEISSCNPKTLFAMNAVIMQAALHSSCTWALNMIMGAALDLNIGPGRLEHKAIREASQGLSDEVFDLPLFNMLRRKKEDEYEEEAVEEGPRACESVISDLCRLRRRLNGYHLSEDSINELDISNALDSGCPLKFGEIMAALAVDLDSRQELKLTGLVHLLNGAKIPAISQIISQHRQWDHALLCIRNEQNCDSLEDLLYRTQPRNEHDYFNDVEHSTTWENKQLRSKVL
jgi:hypothetical protein